MGSKGGLKSCANPPSRVRRDTQPALGMLILGSSACLAGWPDHSRWQLTKNGSRPSAPTRPGQPRRVSRARPACDLRRGRTVRSSADQRGRLGPLLARSHRLRLRWLTWATSWVAFFVGPLVRLDPKGARARKAELIPTALTSGPFGRVGTSGSRNSFIPKRPAHV